LTLSAPLAHVLSRLSKYRPSHYESKQLITLLLALAAAFLFDLRFNQASSPFGEINEPFTGSYSDKTLGYLLSGAIAGAQRELPV
jgi:hypothetical protein